MIKRIDLFMPPKNRYQLLHVFTKQLAGALERLEINCRILEAENFNPKEFLDTIFADPPDCTLSFNGLLPDSEGRFFCDLIRIPHVACIVDAPYHFISLVHSPLSIIVTPDRFTCDFFENLHDYRNVLFMPHAADRATYIPGEANLSAQRPIDILMLASFIDHEKIWNGWRNQYSPPICKALEEAAEMSLENQQYPYVNALAESLNRHAMVAGFDPTQLDFVAILDQLKNYMNGKDRVELVQAIEDLEVHIYGTESQHWKKYLKNKKNIILHPAVSYEQALELMRQAKILLNSSPAIKNGAHERVFSGMLSGAALISNENIYLHENFKNKESILFYQYGKWEAVNQLAREYLQNEPKRKELVKNAQQIVLQGHTWDHRAATLISELTPILHTILK